jgi:hypothetical protein
MALGEEPPKKVWVVQKLPIKGGNVLRSAILQSECFRIPDWVHVEGLVKS